MKRPADSAAKPTVAVTVGLCVAWVLFALIVLATFPVVAALTHVLWRLLALGWELS